MLGGATRGRSLSFQCHVAGNMILGLGAFEVIFVYCFIEYIGSLSVILIIALSFIQCSDTVGQERHSAHKPSATLACVGCGFFVQNPSDADLSHDQN